MINHLTIQGLAIIDSLSIEFSPGFNVITGETGAGKSILIRALNLLMGGKASPDIVRKGSDCATITGEFQVPPNHPALIVMGNLGIPVEESKEGSSLLIRRQVTSKGRSQIWVNDTLVTSHSLRELGTTLVDVFGQHENQKLMDGHSHIRYIDSFLKDPALLGRVQRLAVECGALVRELGQTLATLAESQKNKDYLLFRNEAFEKFGPSLEDFERISQFCQKADGVVNLRDTIGQVQAALEGGGAGLSASLWEAARLLARAGKATVAAAEAANLEVLQTRAGEIATQLDDFSYEISKLLASFDIDESELEEAQSRLFGYQELFRKHSAATIDDLLRETDRLKKELEDLESATFDIEKALTTLAGKTEELEKSTRELSKAREKAANFIKVGIQKELHDLAMPGAQFEVEFSPVQRQIASPPFGEFGEKAVSLWQKVAGKLEGLGDSGAERGQFLLASNPGEPMMPLNRIASGGELSRIMLAFKKTLAADAETCVLVFDEIDTGISGRVADVVGGKMSELASTFQVICISHLPQVAVYADTHFLVQKSGKGERTETAILRLTRDESAREIARLLSGAEVSTPSLANARSLIKRAREQNSKSPRETSRALQ